MTTSICWFEIALTILLFFYCFRKCFSIMDWSVSIRISNDSLTTFTRSSGTRTFRLSFYWCYYWPNWSVGGARERSPKTKNFFPEFWV